MLLLRRATAAAGTTTSRGAAASGCCYCVELLLLRARRLSFPQINGSSSFSGLSIHDFCAMYNSNVVQVQIIHELVVIGHI